MPKLKPRQCPYCGRQFTPRRRHQRYHDRACRLAVRSSRRNHQRYYARREREQASFEASLTSTPDATCVECGAGMSVVRSTRRYCSNACRQRAKRWRLPNVARIQALFDQAMARIHAKLESHRRQQLLRAAEGGDSAAAAELHCAARQERDRRRRGGESRATDYARTR
jgi:hypothetical protein